MLASVFGRIIDVLQMSEKGWFGKRFDVAVDDVRDRDVLRLSNQG